MHVQLSPQQQPPSVAGRGVPLAAFGFVTAAMTLSQILLLLARNGPPPTSAQPAPQGATIP